VFASGRGTVIAESAGKGRRLVATIALLVGWVTFAGSASPADLKPRQVVAEFEVAPDGDFLRVPVTIGQKEYHFLVSTGLVTTTIDQALAAQLELQKIKVEIRGKRGGQVRDRFGGLRAALGNIPLEFPGGVETGDYTALRDRLELACDGELGMDVLQRYVVQIDFDEGILRLLNSLPPSPGEALRITPLGGENGAPTVLVMIPGVPAEKFIVSTARAGNALEIRSELVTQLEAKQQVRFLDKQKSITRSGTLLYQTGRLEAVQIGKNTHEGLLVNTAEQNGIGLSFLARFVVTFDFPHNRMYLKKGKNFDAPESQLDLWEVGVNRDGDQVVIREVDAYGPAKRLGVRAGDIVESINDCDVKRLSTWQIRRLLGREGRPLSAIVLRGSERLTLETGATAASAASDEEK
jgi:hypothetical protein